MAVLERDGYACQFPGCTKTKASTSLEVHHIRPYSKAKYLRTDLINGITLCVDCHARLKNREESAAPMLFRIVKKNMGLDNDKNTTKPNS